jgi:hypothetical protein
MSDLRERIAAAVVEKLSKRRDGRVEFSPYDVADAVIADIGAALLGAIQGYAQSELVGIDFHDPLHKETAYEAMQKLNRDAQGIVSYAMTYRGGGRDE